MPPFWENAPAEEPANKPFWEQEEPEKPMGLSRPFWEKPDSARHQVAETTFLGRAATGIKKGVATSALDMAEGITIGLGMFGERSDEEMRELRRELFAERRAAMEASEGGGLTEAAARDISRFMTYFIPGFGALKLVGFGAKTAKGLQAAGLGTRTAAVTGLVAEGELAALVAENAAFSPYEARLSNLIESVPELRSPITEYLAADEGDPEATARLKQNLEALGMGLFATPIVQAVGYGSKGALKAMIGKPVPPRQGGTRASNLLGSKTQVTKGTEGFILERPELVDTVRPAEGGGWEMGGQTFPDFKTAKAAFELQDNVIGRAKRLSELLGGDDEGVRSAIGSTAAAMERQTLNGGDPMEGVAKFDLMLHYLDPNEEVIDDITRANLRRRIVEPEKRAGEVEGPGHAERIFTESQQAAEEKARTTGARLWNRLSSSFVDHAGPVKSRLLAAGGDLGEEAIKRFELAAGSSAKADFIFQGWREELYAPLVSGPRGRLLGSMPKEDRQSLDRMIQYIRGHEIAQTNPDAAAKVRVLISPGLPRQAKRISPKSFLSDLEGMKNALGAEKYDLLLARANRYFDAMREQLANMRDAGLIDSNEWDAMRTFNYQPRDMLTMIDPWESYTIGGNKVSVRSSGIEPLGKIGEKLVETDSAFLLAQVISRTQSRIAKNEAAVKLGRMATALPDNGVVWNKKPKGVETTEISYMDGGYRNRVFMDSELAQYWITKGQLIGPQAADMLNVISGAGIVRTLATGVNPEFAFRNMPRDLLYIYLTTNEFSQALPVATLQMVGDLARVSKDAWTKSGRYEDYIMEGGGMSFLTHGARMHTQPKLGTHWERAKEFLGKFNEFSEVSARLMLRERAMQNGADSETATWYARRYIDFSQGGTATKMADTVIPYLNASVQGIRGFARYVKNDPVKAAGKLSQLGAATSAVWLYNEFNYPEVMSQISPEEKARFYIFPTGQSYIDDRGNTRHVYGRVAVEHSAMPFKNMFEAMLAREVHGEIPTRQMVESFKSAFSIVGDPAGAIPPILKAGIQYASNYDFWTKGSIWSGPDVDPTEEFKVAPNTPTSMMARDFADKVKSSTGISLSPARLESSISAIIPRNPYVGVVGLGYDVLRKDPTYMEMKNNSTQEMFARFPIIRKMAGVTHPLSVDLEGMTEANRAVEGERLRQNRKIDALSVQAYTEGNFGSGPQLEQIKEMARQADPLDAERLVERYLRGIFARRAAKQLDDIDYYAARSPDWWLAVGGIQPKARAEIIYEVWRGIPSNKRSRFERHVFKMPAAHSDQFLIEYNRLKQERGSDWP